MGDISLVKRSSISIGTIGVVATGLLLNPGTPARAVTFTTLAVFPSSQSGTLKGKRPLGALTLGGNGNIYGTTSQGGTSDLGTVFGINTSTDSVSTLVSLTTASGSQPRGRLYVDSAGTVFGTTRLGGANNGGALFRVTPFFNTLSTLISFAPSTGVQPSAGLTAGAGGLVYGATFAGGTSLTGTVFSLRPSNSSFTALASFSSNSGGGQPSNATTDLSFDGNSDLYGTTLSGGAHLNGTVYKYSPTANTITTVASYPANPDTPSDRGGVAVDASGAVYGTTPPDSTSGALGTLFRIAPGSNVMTTLANFTASSGYRVFAAPIVDAEGNVYGVAQDAGASGAGSVFRYDADSQVISALWSFNSTSGGNSPRAGMAVDSDGNFYGTTYAGGEGFGTVFKLTDTGYVDSTVTNSTWTSSGGGTWSTSLAWSAGVPDSVGSSATFGSSITAPATIAVGTARTVGTINFNNTRAYTLSGGTITLDAIAAPASVNVTAGQHVIAPAFAISDDTTISTSSGTSVSFTGSVSTMSSKTVTKTGPGTVRFAGLTIHGLAINAGTVQLTGSAKVDVLSFTGGPSAPAGKLDLGSSALVIDTAGVLGSRLDDVESAIKSARGTPNAAGVYPNIGNGITSSTVLAGNTTFNQFAVGAISNEDLNTFNGPGSAHTSFGGINVDPYFVLVRYTYAGDANLDGKIDVKDYSLINRGSAGTIPNVGWLSGDFNLDGFINATDYSIIDFGYLRQGATLGLDSAVAVPEPGGSALVGVILGALGSRRRGGNLNAKRF